MKRIDAKYEVVKELGAGAMGNVYEARHERTGRRVAVKVIKEEAKLEPGVVERFHREARAAGSIESDNITGVLDGGVDRDTGSPYIVMELLSGEDLDAAIKRLGPLQPELATRIAAQMLMGLERAHEAGVVHRDIKPANVFLARKGESVVVKVSDFGVAKVKPNALGDSENNALTQSSSLLGSPVYMSPEQAKGSKAIDARTDLWSTGIVLYQLLTGDTPHAHADTLGLLLLAICSEKVSPVRKKAPWVSPKLDAVVSRALEMDADARFQSARQMLEALLSTLPDAKTDLHASMFVPLSDDDRTPIVDPGALAATVAEPKPLEASLNASLSKSVDRPLPPPAPKDRPRWIYAAGGALALTTIGVVASRLGGTTETPAAPSAIVSSPAAPPPVTADPTTAPIASASVATPSAASAPPAPSAAPSVSAQAAPAIKAAAPKPRAPVRASTTASAPSTASAPPSTVPPPSSSGVLRKWP